MHSAEKPQDLTLEMGASLHGPFQVRGYKQRTYSFSLTPLSGPAGQPVNWLYFMMSFLLHS